MKYLLLGILLSSTVQAEIIFESGDERNHILSAFQNDDCKEECSNFYRNLELYSPENLFVLRFDDNKFNEEHLLISTINGAEKVSPQYFLNHSVLSTDFYNYIDLRDLKRNVVGNLKVSFDNYTLKSSFSPKKEEYVEENLYNQIKNIKTQHIVDDIEFNKNNITFYVAVTTPEKREYIEKGVNEGHFIPKNSDVIYFDSIKSSDLTWSLEIPYKSFDIDSLAFVVWIEDENKNVIQSSSSRFYRFSY